MVAYVSVHLLSPWHTSFLSSSLSSLACSDAPPQDPPLHPIYHGTSLRSVHTLCMRQGGEKTTVINIVTDSNKHLTIIYITRLHKINTCIHYYMIIIIIMAVSKSVELKKKIICIIFMLKAAQLHPFWFSFFW